MEEASRSFRWLFTEEELQNTPSVQAGVSLEQELTFRQKQAMLIQTIGLKSGLTQLAVNTSVIFMHRFFMFRTVKAFPRVQLAIGFAFAGGKVEESARKLEHLIRTAVEVIRHNRNKEFLDKSDPLTYEMDCQWRSKMEALCQSNCNIESGAYLEMKKLVLECETEIYAVIGFQLQIVHPHNYVIRMCALLGAENIKDISQYAYNLATASSQLTMLCLKYKPETIATMCLNIASKAHYVRFEPMKDSNVKWYQVIVPSTDFAEVEAVSEEFLQLIKECPLLPSWMSNLARISRANNNRAMPGPARGPGASSASAPQGGRQGQPAPVAPALSSAAATLASIPQPTSAMSQSYPTRPTYPVATSSLPTSQNSEPQQSLSSARAVGLQPSQSELKISPNNKPGSGEGTAQDASLQSSHSRSHPSGGAAHMRPPQPSSGVTQHHHQHQQHRTYPPGSGQSHQGVPASSGSRPSSKLSQPPVPANQGARPPTAPHVGQLQPHPVGHQSSRPGHDQVRSQQEQPHPHDPSRSHSETTKVYDPSRPRDMSRTYEQMRPQETSRHSHVRSDRRSDVPMDGKRSSAGRAQPARSEQQLPQLASEMTHAAHSSPSEPVTEASQFVQATADAPDTNLNSSSPDNISRLQSNPDSQKKAQTNPGPRLSLTMYRERASAKSQTPAEQNAQVEDASAAVKSVEETFIQGSNSKSVTSSPTEPDMKQSLSNSDLVNFSKPQDSPNNPRIKIRVKRDPSSGQRHVKYPDTGLKIKIKPLRSETGGGSEGEAGPSGLASSRSSTPREEGEIVDDTPPSSCDSEQKSERLKIRLTVPKPEHAPGYNRRENELGSNGYSGERDSSHRSHHHGHHRSHHHSKSKKHSKHERSRHEGRSSGKRLASSMDYHDERPSKASRSDTYPVPGVDINHHLAGYSDFSSGNSSSRTLQQQNSGFSINDAFSSAMPHNIFDDDDDDPSHFHSPVTPTADVVPAHHERFHQIMAQHRAETSKRPPLPKGPPPQVSPPPPPPSPPTL